jgi:hypothetical protein
VPSPDDEKFELYLKQFRLRSPEPITVQHRTVPRRTFALAAWIAAGAVVAVLSGFELHHRSNPTNAVLITRDGAMIEHLLDTQALTLRSANALMATAPSFKAAVDNMAFRSQTPSLAKGDHSAVAVLSKEKIML